MSDIPVLVRSGDPDNYDGELVLGREGVRPSEAVKVLPAEAPELLLPGKQFRDVLPGDTLESLPYKQFVLSWKFDLELSGKENTELMMLAKLVQAYTTRRPGSVNAYIRYKAVIGRRSKRKSESPESAEEREAKRTWKEFSASPVGYLCRELNRKMRRVRYVIWWSKKEKKLLPGLYCGEDAQTAIAAVLFSRMASPRGLAQCERCANRFIRTKQAQRFCSLRCGNADRKARQRKQGKRGKPATKKGQ